MKKLQLRVLFLAGQLVLICAACGCDRGQSNTESPDRKTNTTFESPEAAFAAMREAMLQKDMARFVECLSPTAANQFVGEALLDSMNRAERLARDEDNKAQAEAIRALLKKHQVASEDLKSKLPESKGNAGDRDRRSRAAGALVKDKGAFMTALLESYGEAQSQEHILDNAKLIDVKVDGNQATARMVAIRNGSKHYEPFRFRKIDGSWLIHMTSSDEKNAPKQITTSSGKPAKSSGEPVTRSGKPARSSGEPARFSGKPANAAGERKARDPSDSLTIGLVACLPEPLLGVLKKGSIQAANEFNVQLSLKLGTLKESDESLPFQLRSVNELLGRDDEGRSNKTAVDALAIVPFDPEKLPMFLGDAIKAVPMVTCHTDFEDRSAYPRRFANVGIDNYLAGRMAGWLVKQATPKGVVAVFSGWLDHPDVKLRWQGLVDELLDRGRDAMRFDREDRISGENYVIIRAPMDEFELRQARELAVNTLTDHNDLHCLVGLLDYHIPVLDRVVAEHGRDRKLAVIGFGAQPETLEAIEAGRCQGSVVGDYYKYAYEAVRLLAHAAKGMNPKLDVENRMIVKPRVVIQKNVKQFRDELRQLADPNANYSPKFDFSPNLRIPTSAEPSENLPKRESDGEDDTPPSSQESEEDKVQEPPADTVASSGNENFKRHCATCHSYLDERGFGISGPATRADRKPNGAANLYGFASRKWLRGFLDPNRFLHVTYFGNTAHRNGDMANVVTSDLKDLGREDRELLEKVIITLSAEAGLPSQRAMDQQSKKDGTVETGIEVFGSGIGSVVCADCHHFREHEDGEGAPNLTGYGSREWLIQFISDPSTDRFYGDKNDRMPSFAKHGHTGAGKRLTKQQIEAVVDWIRQEKPPSSLTGAKPTTAADANLSREP